MPYFMRACGLVLVCSFLYLAPNNVSDFETTREFSLETSVAQVSDWAAGHSADVRKALGLKLLEQDGTRHKVSKQTLKGKFVFTLQETMETVDGVFVYQTELIDCQQGGLKLQSTRVTATQVGSRVRIRVYFRTQIDNPRIRSNDLRLDTLQSILKIRNMLERDLHESAANNQQNQSND